MAYRCNQVEDSDCEGQTNCECFACGLPVCKSCSRVTPYYRYGNKRLCLNCLREYEAEDKRLFKMKAHSAVVLPDTELTDVMLICKGCTEKEKQIIGYKRTGMWTWKCPKCNHTIQVAKDYTPRLHK